MKRILALLLSGTMLLTGCSSSVSNDNDILSSQTDMKIELQEESSETTEETKNVTESNIEELVWTDIRPEYTDFDDELIAHVEDLVYMEAVQSLDDEKFFVENVSAVYISQEYLDEVAFNSQSNIYFGYSLAELDEIFEGTRYIFTLGEDGTTDVKELVEIEDTDTDTIIKNVAIGTGVILVCVTVSVLTAGTGSAAAISVIFATAAKTAAVAAGSSAAIGGVSAGVVRGIETGDMNEALDAAVLGASEGFKWGAITGAVSGGAAGTVKYAKAMKALKGTELVGITKQQAAAIQMETGFPVDVIKQFTKYEQYEICQKAGLMAKMVNGKTALVRKLDLNFVDDMGRTNLQRMQQGLAALDPATGKAYQLHHIGQKADSTLAILTESEHMQGGNNTIWHNLDKATEVHGVGNNWDAQRQTFWKSMAKSLGG